MKSGTNEYLEWLISQKKEMEQHAENEYNNDREMYDKFMEHAKIIHMCICELKSKIAKDPP